jgi:hypothetical protein
MLLKFCGGSPTVATVWLHINQRHFRNPIVTAQFTVKQSTPK